jgi:hypothetical protein
MFTGTQTQTEKTETKTETLEQTLRIEALKDDTLRVSGRIVDLFKEENASVEVAILALETVKRTMITCITEDAILHILGRVGEKN